jgi:beta-glucosidase
MQIEPASPIRLEHEDNRKRAQELVDAMTLAEKIGQMTQAEKNSITPEDVTRFAIGSVLSGGGGNPVPNTVATWREMVVAYQEAALRTRLRIPLIYGSDAVHGHSNVVGAVIFPQNIGLGSARDADLVRRIAAATAKELLATSVHWNFAPAVSVPQDIRWGRTYEGYGENTEIVRELGVAYLESLQDAGVLASVKHFVADGGTTWGTTRRYEWITGNWQAPDDSFSIDQGDARMDEESLRRVHLQPYIDAIHAGALNIMVSFSSWNGDKMHDHRYLLTDVLKGEYGFEGFLVSDWMAINQLDPDYDTCVVRAINAGIDMVMVPFDFKLFVNALTAAVERGDVSTERIDDAVRRILLAKMWLGLFESPFGAEDFVREVGSDAHRRLAREAVQKSLVLLKNEGGTLPIPRTTSKLLLAGRGADNVGMQCGGWTIDWQGGHGRTTEGTSIYDALKAAFSEEAILYSEAADFDSHAGIGLVVVGEDPYAEGLGDRNTLCLSEADVSVIEKMRAQCDRLVVVLLSGRPLLISDQLALADAFVAAWLPGTEGAGIVDCLLGETPFTGKLRYSWPRSAEQIPLSALKAHDQAPLFPIGYGLTD